MLHSATPAVNGGRSSCARTCPRPLVTFHHDAAVLVPHNLAVEQAAADAVARQNRADCAHGKHTTLAAIANDANARSSSVERLSVAKN